MGRQVGFAVIGCGMISQFHIDAISGIEEAVLVGVHDVVREHGEKTAARHQVKYYGSLEEIWQDEAVEAVCICTPSGLHAAAACEALIHGRHVLVEKPMALTLEDCDRILGLAREHHVKVSVVSQLRFSPAVQQARQLIQEKALGKLLNADLYMKYYRSQEYYDSGGWRGTWAMDGGGALMNQGIHGVDLLLYLAGPVESVFARAATLARKIEVEDTLSGVAVFENGALGVIQADTGVYPGFPRRIELCGDKGSLILEEDKIVYAAFDEEASARTTAVNTAITDSPGSESGEAWKEACRREAGTENKGIMQEKDSGRREAGTGNKGIMQEKDSGRREAGTENKGIMQEKDSGRREAGTESNNTVPEKDFSSGHQNPGAISADGHFLQVRNLVNAILYEEPLLVDGHEGRKAVELILRIYQSAREGKAVTYLQ